MVGNVSTIHLTALSSGLARCVAVVGMPYPNSKDPLLQEKIAWINRRYTDTKSSAQKPGSQYYENLCMRAVNQSIGRSIRHKGDFASVLLIDERYCTKRVSDQLPAWIRSRFFPTSSFGDAFRRFAKFFAKKKKNT